MPSESPLDANNRKYSMSLCQENYTINQRNENDKQYQQMYLRESTATLTRSALFGFAKIGWINGTAMGILS